MLLRYLNASFICLSNEHKLIHWPRTKIKHLLAMGFSLKTIQHGGSSKSYWHMARTPAMRQALNNDRLQRQGVPSIRQLWCKAQGYTS